MKIVDEKGKLFGKINVIDFLVILFLLCILPAFYFGYKVATRKLVEVEPPKREFVEIEIDYQFIKLKPEVLKLISVGDKELDRNGQVIGRITSLGESEPYRYTFDIGAGQRISKGDPILRQLKARIKLKAKVEQSNLYYKDKEIKVGLPLEFKTNEYSVTAIPFKEEEEEEAEALIEVDYQFIKLKPEVLKLISVGDKELDENVQVIGEIISLGQSEPYKYEFDMGKGQKVIKEDPVLKQMRARVRLKAAIKENKIYYKGEEIKVDVPLEFNADKYSIIGFLGKKEVKIIGEERIDLFVTLKDLDEDKLKKISVGDKEVNENGETIAEILSLGKIENNSLELSLGGGNFVRGETDRKRQISTKMRLKCRLIRTKAEGTNRLYFKGKQIRYNNPIEFKTDEYKAMGMIAQTFEIISPLLVLKEKWITLQLKLTGVAPEIASIIQKEDVERDPSGAVVAKVDSVVSNKSSQVLSLQNNKFITLKHPFNKDILLSLSVKCTEKAGVYYFKNYSVKMGNSLAFATDLYSVSGTIVGMEME